jgi:hypothetical protein
VSLPQWSRLPGALIAPGNGATGMWARTSLPIAQDQSSRRLRPLGEKCRFRITNGKSANISFWRPGPGSRADALPFFDTAVCASGSFRSRDRSPQVLGSNGSGPHADATWPSKRPSRILPLATYRSAQSFTAINCETVAAIGSVSASSWSAVREYAEPAAAVDSIRLKIRMVDSQNGRQRLPLGEMHENSVVEIHGAIPIP